MIRDITKREQIMIIVAAAMSLLCTILLFAIITRGAKISLLQSKIDELELNPNAVSFDKQMYESRVLLLEMDNKRMLTDNILLKKANTALEKEVAIHKQQESKLQYQLKKLKDEIKYFEKPNIDYRDSSIFAIDSLLPK